MNETKSQDRISVIVPVYNTAPYLKRCLDSVLQSTYQNLEMICVNDGSTDGSLSILEHYQALDDRVVVIDQNNNGLSVARNTGMARATGDLISFVDSDDWVHPRMFELLRNAMADDVCMAVCGAKWVYREEPIEPLHSAPHIQKYVSLKDGYKTDVIVKRVVWGRLYRTSLVSGVFFEDKMTPGEDTLFNLMLAERPGKCAVVEEKLYFYFQRNDSLIHTDRLEQWAETVDIFIRVAGKQNTALQSMIYEEAVKLAFIYRYMFMFSPERKQAAKAAKAAIREALNEVRKNRLISKNKIAAYTIMNDFPILYRIYRIALDPTLLDWEKKQKKVLKSTYTRSEI